MCVRGVVLVGFQLVEGVGSGGGRVGIGSSGGMAGVRVQRGQTLERIGEAIVERNKIQLLSNIKKKQNYQIL